MADGGIDRGGARRLSGAERRGEILAAAARALADQGFLPVTIEQVAREAGISKALIYTHFPNAPALYGALLDTALDAIEARLAAITATTFEAKAAAAALAYFDEIAEHGLRLHILFTDAFLNDARSRQALARRDALWLRLLRASRAHIKATHAERVAAMAILLAIPEDLAQRAQRGETPRERARALCKQLVLSSLKGLRAAAQP